jgi:hypothetical protein
MHIPPTDYQYQKLHEELVNSIANSSMTDELISIFTEMSYDFVKRRKYINEEEKEDCRKYILLMLFQFWWKYNPDRGKSAKVFFIVILQSAHARWQGKQQKT